MKRISFLLMTVSMLGLGLAQFAFATEWTVFTTDNSPLPHNNVRSLAADQFGVLWIGTWDGLARYSGFDWKTYAAEDLRIDRLDVSAIITDDANSLWIGSTREGFFHYDGFGFSHYREQFSRCGDIIYGFARDADNRIWACGNFGLASLERDRWRKHSAPRASAHAVAINFDNAVVAGLGNNAGLVCTNADEKTRSEFATSGFPATHRQVTSAIYDRDNHLWIGTYGSGLFRYDGKTWLRLHLGNSDIPDNHVEALAVDEHNRLWVGTASKGLALLNEGSWTVFDMENSELPANRVNALLIDDDGTVIIGTTNGLALYGESWTGTAHTSSRTTDLDQNAGQSAERIAESIPNPFRSKTSIRYNLADGAFVTLEIFNQIGDRVAAPVNGFRKAGQHSANFDSGDLPAGVYYYRLHIGDRSETGKLIKIK